MPEGMDVMALEYMFLAHKDARRKMRFGGRWQVQQLRETSESIRADRCDGVGID